LKKLQKDLYDRNLTSIPLLPSEAFLPINTSYLFYSHIFQWQTKILLFIHQKSSTSLITLEEAVNEIKNDPSLERRDVSLINNLTIGAAILEYLQALTTIGLLRNVQRNAYMKQREINWQSSLLDLLKNDEVIMNKFVSK
jgi:competence CoiA-like predicted nuclease